MSHQKNIPKLPDVTIDIVNILGEGACSRGFKIGDSFHYPDDREKMCPAALAVIRPYMMILSYGGKNPFNPDDPTSFSISCPDAKHPVVYKIHR